MNIVGGFLLAFKTEEVGIVQGVQTCAAEDCAGVTNGVQQPPMNKLATLENHAMCDRPAIAAY